jgi:hypothetical protein
MKRIFDPKTLKYVSEDTPEYQIVKNQIEEKRLLDMKGYESRTGHQTQSAIEGKSLKTRVRKYKYIIVYPSTPEIKTVWEYSRGPVIELKEGYGGSSIPIWGYGETEEKAWNMALEDLV